MLNRTMLDKYDYEFPSELIARRPAAPRESARLLIYDRTTGQRQYDTFANLAKYLPPHSVVVFNKTKVVPARLRLHKPTGGEVSALYIGTAGDLVLMLADGKLIPSTTVTCSDISFKIESVEKGVYKLKPSFPIAELFSVLERLGTTPLPPYIKKPELTEAEARQEYQSVFAHEAGSVAAPTASLHFTPQLIANLKAAGHDVMYVTLHVNRGTFAPLTEQQITSGRLHEETYSIAIETAEFLNKAKAQGRPIVAVGTTVLRTLESVTHNGKLEVLQDTTDLFIREGYAFKFIDALITNFHVPKSSLLMLVAALVGREQILNIYRDAIERKFRLFSFGDGMLII